MAKVEIGKKVPDFELPATGDKSVRLSKLKRKTFSERNRIRHG